MCALVLISVHTKFEVPGFNRSKDMMGAPKFKK